MPSAITQNGDDAIELFQRVEQKGYWQVIDTFGEATVDGSGQPWEYVHSWAYRNTLHGGTFDLNQWSFGGVGCTTALGSDNSIEFVSTAETDCPYPFCATKPDPPAPPSPSPPPPQRDLTTAPGTGLADLLMQAQTNATGRPVRVTLASGEHALEATAAVFDNRTTASEVWIDGGATGATIRPKLSNESVVLTVKEGAPPVHLVNVRVIGEVKVEGGELHLTDANLTAESSSEAAMGRQLSEANPAAPPSLPALHLRGVFAMNIDSGSNPGKAVHLYATQDIADLSSYSIGIANNGGGTDGSEFSLSGAAAAGDNIIVVRESLTPLVTSHLCGSQFQRQIIGSSKVSQNGDDAIELFHDTGSGPQLIDTFGDNSVDGTGQPWEYSQSWAYRQTLSFSGAFDVAEWTFGGVGCTASVSIDAVTTEQTNCTYPLCTIPLPPAPPMPPQAPPAPGERALVIAGGQVTLTRAVLHGHQWGAVHVDNANLTCIETNFTENIAPFGAALLVSGASFVRIEGSNFVSNMATVSGGALQVTGSGLIPLPAACTSQHPSTHLTASLPRDCTGRRRPCRSSEPDRFRKQLGANRWRHVDLPLNERDRPVHITYATWSLAQHPDGHFQGAGARSRGVNRLSIPVPCRCRWQHQN